MRGLAEALHSDDATFAGLGEYVAERLEPVVADLLTDARAARSARTSRHRHASSCLHGRLLCQPVSAAGFDSEHNRRMTIVIIDGLQPTKR